MEPPKNLTFDQIEVGQFLGRKTHTVTKEEIARSAKLLGYKNPVYSDEEYAKNSEFGGIVAPPGMIFIYQLLAAVDPFQPGTIRAGDDNAFYALARPGDVITMNVSISDKFTRKERKFVKALVEGTNQNDEKVFKVEVTFIVPN